MDLPKIKVDIWLTRNVKYNPIAISFGSQVPIEMTIKDMPQGAIKRADAFATAQYSGKTYINYPPPAIDGNTVTITPLPGLFVLGWNELQVELYDDNDAPLIPFTIPVHCRKRVSDAGDPATPEEVRPLVERAEAAAADSEASAKRAQQVKDSIPEDYTELAGNVSRLTESITEISEAIFDKKTVEYTTRVNFCINSSNVFSNMNGYGTAQFPIEKGKTYIITKENIGTLRIALANSIPSAGTAVSVIYNSTSDDTFTFKNDTDYKYCIVNKYALSSPNGNVSVKEITKITDVFKPSTVVYVSAFDSDETDKLLSDYVCDGSHDEVEIQQAIDSLENGGTVYLLDGTYNIDGWNHTLNSTNDQGLPRKIAFAIGITTDRNQQNIKICGMNTPVREYGGKVPKCTAVINVTSTALNALTEQGYNIGNVIGCIGYKGSDRLYPKYGLTIENIGFLLADNQHPVYTINAEMFSALEMKNFMITPYQTGGTDAPFPLAINGCIGVRGLLGSNSGKSYTIKNGFVFGMHIGFDLNGEHLVMEQCGVRFSRIPYRFGNNNKTGANTHDLTLINCCHEMCVNGIEFSGFTNKQSVNLYDYNMEKLTNGAYAQVQKAIETGGSQGKWRGNIYYTVCDDSFVNIDDTFFEEGYGHGFNVVNTTMKKYGSTSERPVVANWLQRFFNTDTMKENVYYNGTWVEV